MYRLLIVDDEEFEREGMAQLIDWEHYEVELVGTAWNGVDGFEKTRMLRPDMILTDIKMPVMDGIELIKKVREAYPHIEFAVLSGYGEYEFTSQAMEQGVKHYILKPCDEEKIVGAINKVKKDVDMRREELRRKGEYRNWVIPQAQKQFFQNLLLERVKAEDLFRMWAEKELAHKIRLLVFRSEGSFNGLEEFVLGNMLEELMERGEMKAFVSTVIQTDAVILIADTQPKRLVPVARRIEREFLKIRKEPIRGAVSSSGEPNRIPELYRQTRELFRIGGKAEQAPLLYTEVFAGERKIVNMLLDFDIVGKCRDYGVLLQSLQVTFLRMQKRKFTFLEKRDLMDQVMWLLYGEELRLDKKDILDEDSQSLMVAAARQIYQHTCEKVPDNKENIRYQRTLEEIYRHFQDQKFCLHYLATEILYINEDYFGRFFQKMSGKKFTGFLMDIRIFAAEQLMRLEPDIMVYAVSEMTGYASDGQYFSKIFKKSTGMSPSEYREKIQMEKQ